MAMDESDAWRETGFLPSEPSQWLFFGRSGAPKMPYLWAAGADHNAPLSRWKDGERWGKYRTRRLVLKTHESFTGQFVEEVLP